MERSDFIKLAGSLVWDGKGASPGKNQHRDLRDAIRHVGRLSGAKDTARRLVNLIDERIGKVRFGTWMFGKRPDLPFPTHLQEQQHLRAWVQQLASEFAKKASR